MTPEQALDAIVARINGDWDNPLLFRIGPLGDLSTDILHIIECVRR